MNGVSLWSSEIGLRARPMPGFRPGGRVTFLCAQESNQRRRPCKTAPCGVPCDARSPGPRPTHFATLRSDKGARSQKLKRAARAPRASALLGGLEGESRNSQLQQPNSRKPSPNSGCQRLFLHPPFEPAEQRKVLRARAQHASTSDSAWLFERSVAKRVPGGPSRPEQRRGARCEAKGRAVRGRLFAYFLVAQKVGRPPGRRPGTVQRARDLQAKATGIVSIRELHRKANK
jgi:hypothetical protein